MLTAKSKYACMFAHGQTFLIAEVQVSQIICLLRIDLRLEHVFKAYISILSCIICMK